MDTELAKYLPAQPEGRFSDWEYKEILRLRMPVLVQAGAVDALRLLCDLLCDAVAINRSATKGTTVEQEVREDLSTIWRPRLDEDAGGSHYDIPNSLVTAVKDAAQQLIIGDSSRLVEIIETLQSYRWVIFNRIALHLLHIFRSAAPDLVGRQLTDKTIVQATGLQREYILLLRDAFISLSLERQSDILRIIEEGPDLDKLRGDADADGYARHWRWIRLSPIQDHLPTDWSERWDGLKYEFGKESAIPGEGQISFHWGPEAAILGPEKLSSMLIPEIVAFVKAFKPSKRFFGPSAEDLGSELSGAVSANPEGFSNELIVFHELAPIYLEELLRGFRRSAEAGKSFSWEPVLDLCRHVSNETGDADGGPWRRARREVVDLLHSGLSPRGIEIPFEFRDKVWGSLEKLVEDSDPTPEEEAQQLRNGPYHVAINSTRGRAMEAALFYGRWVYRHYRPPDVDDFTFSLESAPELKAVLDRHLEPADEPSLGVRAVYGVFISTLQRLDVAWINANLGKIFPADEAVEGLRKAAWEAYLCWPQINLSMLELLRKEYQRSIELLGSPALEERGRPDERLAEHLMAFYWHGKIDIADPLLDRYFENASDDVRGEALGYLGRSLRDADGPIEAEVSERLKKLWESRVEAANRDQSRIYRHEMAAFGWWFASGKLDEEWAVKELEASLRIVGVADVDHLVVAQLAGLSSKDPAAAVRCLQLLVDGAEEEWRVHHWSGQAKSVLSTALRSSNDEANRAARVLINRLAARGFLDFGQLLNETSTCRGYASG